MYQFPQRALTDNDIMRVAPSVFADRAYDETSDRYQFIPTSTVIDGLRNEGFEVFKAQESKSRIEGKQGFTKHILRLRHPMQKFDGDSVPEILIMNSHDGTGAYSVRGGIYRFICTNGLIVGRDFLTARVRHQGDVVQRVIEAATDVVGGFGKIISARDKWASTQISDELALEFAKEAQLLKHDPIEVNDQKVMPFPAQKLLVPQRMEDRGTDLWTRMNVIQENLMRGGTHYLTSNEDGKVRRNSTRGVKAVDATLRINTKLWEMTERYAEAA